MLRTGLADDEAASVRLPAGERVGCRDTHVFVFFAIAAVDGWMSGGIVGGCQAGEALAALSTSRQAGAWI